ncbi:hypothetical protein ACFE04_001250 [Oxalis oulophora]
MSGAIVCGKRSSSPSSSSIFVAKRNRFSSSSSSRSSNYHHFPCVFASPIDQLLQLYPHMDKQLLERALDECGNDLDSAITSLNELRLGSHPFTDAAQESHVVVANNGEVSSADNPSAPEVLTMDGADWVELFVNEMTSASNIDDARARAARALGTLEKSICTRARAEAAQSFYPENAALKEQIESLVHENNVLKRVVSSQHERQKEFDEQNQELQNLKPLLAQYQEQLRTLEEAVVISGWIVLQELETCNFKAFYVKRLAGVAEVAFGMGQGENWYPYIMTIPDMLLVHIWSHLC